MTSARARANSAAFGPEILDYAKLIHDLSLRREVRYINGSQRDVDQAYGFGMRWTGARK